MSSDVGGPPMRPIDSGAPQSGPRRGLLRRIAGILPPPRDEALLEVGRGLRDLLRGRAPLSTLNAQRAALAEERWRLDRGRALLARGDPAGALAEVAAVEGLRPASHAAAALRTAATRSGAIRGRQASPTAPATDIPAALDHARRLGHVRPTLLLYHQVSPDNPFQALLYRRAWRHGIAPVPLWELGDLDDIPAVLPADTRPVLHLHWVNRVLHGASGPESAAGRLSAFEAQLDRSIDAGFRVVWTVHNVLPHDTPAEAADTQLRKIIVDRATMVHVLAASTPELAAEHYQIPPEKVVHVPLPSFRGAYVDAIDRPAARYALGLAADAYVVALVGGLRAYKGLDLLLDAVELAASEEPRLRLVVAGSPGRSEAIETFLARAARDPRISLHARQIPSEDMQLFLRAADVAVLPYLRTLNSAVLMMALAFDLPVIAPSIGGIGETIEPAVAVTFEPGDTRSLAQAMLDARSLQPDEVRAAAQRICDAHASEAISDRFMAALLTALEPSRAATP